MIFNPLLKAAGCIAVALSLSGCQSFVSALGFGPRDAAKRAEAHAPIFGSDELERGRAALRAGYPANAIQQFRLAALDPASAAEAFNGLGVAYARLERADLAERYFKMALDLDGTNRRFAANLDRFYNSPLGTSSRALAMRDKEAGQAVAQLAGIAQQASIAQQQGLLETASEVQPERRGAVTLERPAVRIVRAAGREILLASAAEPARDTARPTITVTATRRAALTLAMADSGKLTAPVQDQVQVNVIRPSGAASGSVARQVYPIRIKLASAGPVE